MAAAALIGTVVTVAGPSDTVQAAVPATIPLTFTNNSGRGDQVYVYNLGTELSTARSRGRLPQRHLGLDAYQVAVHRRRREGLPLRDRAGVGPTAAVVGGGGGRPPPPAGTANGVGPRPGAGFFGYPRRSNG
ncbi:hypothetical protein ACWCQ0_46965, partial [Streptomyces massasporeus]